MAGLSPIDLDAGYALALGHIAILPLAFRNIQRSHSENSSLNIKGRSYDGNFMRYSTRFIIFLKTFKEGVDNR